MLKVRRLFCIASIGLIGLLSGCTAMLDGGPATTASNSSPDEASTSLLLHQGTFVAADASCGDPPLAALLVYNGRGFDGAHSHACRARVVARQADQVTLANSCIDAGVGPAPRTTLPLTLKLVDGDHFVVRSDTGDQAYRRCPADQLPLGLRRRASSDH